MGRDLVALRAKARPTADAKGYAVNIYRLVTLAEAFGESYLVVRKILEPGQRGQPHVHWALADTQQAAEVLRDVSSGLSPYFGAILAESCQPPAAALSCPGK